VAGVFEHHVLTQVPDKFWREMQRVSNLNFKTSRIAKAPWGMGCSFWLSDLVNALLVHVQRTYYKLQLSSAGCMVHLKKQNALISSKERDQYLHGRSNALALAVHINTLLDCAPWQNVLKSGSEWHSQNSPPSAHDKYQRSENALEKP
jgi:hypothetical protein